MNQPEFNYMPEKGKIYDYFSLIINSMRITDINQLYKDFNLSTDDAISFSYSRIYTYIREKQSDLLCLLFTLNDNGKSYFSMFSNLLLDTYDIEEVINKILNYNTNDLIINILSFLDTNHNLSDYTYKKILNDKDIVFDYVNSLNISLEFKWTFIKFIENPKLMLDELYNSLISIKNEIDIEYKILKEYREKYYALLKKKIDETLYKYENLNNLLPLNNISFKGIAFEKINIHVLTYLPYSIQSICSNHIMNIYLGFYHEEFFNRRIADNNEITSIFKAFSDKMRMKIINVIQKNPNICFKDIGKIIKIPLSTLSHHLDIIIEAGIVKKSNSGKKTLFLIEDSGLDYAIKLLKNMKG